MKIGIVGHEGGKFTPKMEIAARKVIREILILNDCTLMISGRCHLGGIDIWAEEEAKKLNIEIKPFPPKILEWNGGYRERNLKIAKNSDVIYVIVVNRYPPNYVGMTFDYCYHCHTSDHIKSGACWTAKQAQKLGKPAHWKVLRYGIDDQ